VVVGDVCFVGGASAVLRVGTRQGRGQYGAELTVGWVEYVLVGRSSVRPCPNPPHCSCSFSLSLVDPPVVGHVGLKWRYASVSNLGVGVVAIAVVVVGWGKRWCFPGGATTTESIRPCRMRQSMNRSNGGDR
jgi:hypothetical protein